MFACVPLFAQNFVFDLSGAQEVPPTPSLATGGCMGVLDSGASTFSITCAHNVAGATLMHIHRGAAGVNGSVAFDMGDPTSPVVATWTAMTPADIADLLAGNLYINIHTAGRPAGEIRGQILPRTVDTVAFAMNSAQVVPPGPGSASGSCTADLDNPATSLAVNCTHNLPSPSDAHVHNAPFGENGPVVFTFPSAASPLSGNVPMAPLLVANFAATFLYVDVHGTGSESSYTGEIRGQIGTPPAPPSTGTIRITKSTTPAGGTGFNFTDNVPGSPGSFVLNDGATQTFANVTPGTYTITEALPGGYTLTDLACSDSDSSGNVFARTATVALQAAETVTCTFTNLKNFGPTSSLFVLDLSGAQEVPPVDTPERGGCMGQFDAGTSALSLVCTHDVADPSLMHIHRGAAGTNGAVAFDLGNPASPIEAVWTGMTPADVADLFAGNLYINIHTSGRPSGTIRGQILPRAIDAFSFGMTGAQEVPPTSSTDIGNCSADLSNDAASMALQCTNSVQNITAVHLHSAPPGVDGPIAFDLPATSFFAVNVPMSPRMVADFEAGFLYVNVHSTDFPQGAIRGQAIASAPALANATGAPTLSEWALMLLGIALAMVAWVRLRTSCAR